MDRPCEGGGNGTVGGMSAYYEHERDVIYFVVLVDSVCVWSGEAIVLVEYYGTDVRLMAFFLEGFGDRDRELVEVGNCRMWET